MSPFGRVRFSFFFSLARDALVALLREHGKGEQAERLMRGELTELNLDDCEIGDDGAEIVADFLKHDEIVIEVRLFGCNIGLREVKFIAEALKQNQSVKIIHFQYNRIDDEGAKALIEALNCNLSITSLVVYGNPIAPEFQEAIEYLSDTRNKTLIPAAVRRASLFIIIARRILANAGSFSIFPKEIVKMIAMKVWATRKDPIWIEALSESERSGSQ